MEREIRVSDAAMKICGLFYKIYRVMPSSVHGRQLRVYVEDLPKRQLLRNLGELSDIIEYRIVVNKRRLTAEEAERYFSGSSAPSAERREKVGAFVEQITGT